MCELNDIVKSGKQPVERSALSDRNVSGVFSALPNHLKTIRFFRHDRAQSRPSRSCLLAIKEDVTKTRERKST
jgi:hypothetical protein